MREAISLDDLLVITYFQMEKLSDRSPVFYYAFELYIEMLDEISTHNLKTFFYHYGNNLNKIKLIPTQYCYNTTSSHISM